MSFSRCCDGFTRRDKIGQNFAGCSRNFKNHYEQPVSSLNLSFASFSALLPSTAAARLPALEEVNALWLEEPFHTSALDQYASLAFISKQIKLAGGEGAHNYHMATHLIAYGRVGYIQVDCGRIGGIGPAKRVADYAVANHVTFVNHTFTSHLALSASLQPYAGLREHEICEYPFAPKPLAWDFTSNHLQRDSDGYITLSDSPGLGIGINAEAARSYLVDVEIRANGKSLFSSPDEF